MTDQTIPAEKVRELAEKYDNAPGNPDRLLVNAIADLRALLPSPPQPTTGLLGRWAKHPERGDVLCVTDEPFDGQVHVFHPHHGRGGSLGYLASMSDLTFPHQATKPEDVPADQPWLVDVNTAHVTAHNAVGMRYEDGGWHFLYVEDGLDWDVCPDEGIALIAPLTPERPGKDDLVWKYAILQQDYAHLEEECNDLQDRYDELEKRWNHLDDLYSARGRYLDELETKYQEAQARIKTLEQTSTPRTVATEAEYAALPVGSVVHIPNGFPWTKDDDGEWKSVPLGIPRSSAEISEYNIPRTILRHGWGDEEPKPVCRIEHDWRNLRVGEYIIDRDDDTGTVLFHNKTTGAVTDWAARGIAFFAPFIVFPSKDAATPEAVAEAKKARDKGMGNG